MHTPDSAISYQRQNGKLRMWFASLSSAVLMQGSDFESLQPYPLLNGFAQPVLTPSGSGFDSNYAGAGAVIKAGNGTDLLLFYHGEHHPCGGPYPFMAGIGLARSSDGGVTWQRRGQVISTAVPTPTGCDFPIWGVGNPTVYRSRDGRYLYMLFMEWFRGDPVDRPDVPYLARATVESDGEPGSWWKYANGEFSEPGLGGLGSPVMGQPPPSGDATVYAGLGSVSFNTSINAYLLIVQSRLGLHVAISQDGIQWGTARLFWETPDFSSTDYWVAYETLISPDQPSQETTGNTGYLYFARGNPNGYPPHYMSRRGFRIIPRLAVAGIDSSAIEIVYFACSNITYQLQWTTTLNSDDWWPANDPVVGEAKVENANLPFDGIKRRFYRLRADH